MSNLLLPFIVVIILVVAGITVARLRLYRPGGKYGRKGLFFTALAGLLLLSACAVTASIFGLDRSMSRLAGRPEPTPTLFPFERGIPTTQVIVALQPIERGSEFVAGSIGRRDWPANNVPPNVIADEAETIGKVARIDIIQGQIIVRDMLIDVGVLNPFPAPVEVNGLVYFGRNDGIFYALDSETGQEVWRFQANRQVFSSPTPADGRLFFADGEGTLYALEARSGRELWRNTTPNPIFHPEPVAPMVINGVVYLSNRSEQTFYAIDARTGRERWRHSLLGKAVFAAGRVYFVLNDGTAAAVLDLDTGQPAQTESDE